MIALVGHTLLRVAAWETAVVHVVSFARGHAPLSQMPDLVAPQRSTNDAGHATPSRAGSQRTLPEARQAPEGQWVRIPPSVRSRGGSLGIEEIANGHREGCSGHCPKQTASVQRVGQCFILIQRGENMGPGIRGPVQFTVGVEAHSRAACLPAAASICSMESWPAERQ